MELIRDIGIKNPNNGSRGYRYGIFKCPVCGKEVEKILKDGIRASRCSHKCYALTREKRGAYKRMVINKKYVYIYKPDHPHAIGTKKLYVAEHRLVMENAMGRYLTEDEVVHHIDGDTKNNDIKNLLLMTPSEHGKLHSKLKERKDGKYKANKVQGI